MIIHCLPCGKAVSSNSLCCPYCYSEISDLTLEANGIMEKAKLTEKLREMMLQFGHKQVN